MSNTKRNTYSQKGVSIVEAIVAIAIISVAFAAILSATIFFLRGGLYATSQAQALFLLDEGFEAMRFLRDESYTNNIIPLVGTGAFYLVPNSSGWTTSTTNAPVLGKFTKELYISEVHRRNSDDDIVSSTSLDPKTIDAGTVKVDTIISWATGSVRGTTYITDLYEN